MMGIREEGLLRISCERVDLSLKFKFRLKDKYSDGMMNNKHKHSISNVFLCVKGQKFSMGFCGDLFLVRGFLGVLILASILSSLSLEILTSKVPHPQDGYQKYTLYDFICTVCHPIP